jgi:hypothetical protein
VKEVHNLGILQTGFSDFNFISGENHMPAPPCVNIIVRLAQTPALWGLRFREATCET